MRNQRLQGGRRHGHVPDFAATRPKYAQRPSPVSQASGAGIIDTFLATICELDRYGLDDVQSEMVAAILEVAFVTDELRWRGDNAANANRAERQVGDVDARATAAVVYHVQRQVARKLVTEGGEPRALGQHLGRPSQKVR